MYGSQPNSLRLIENWLVPRGKVFMINDRELTHLGGPAMVAHPATMMRVMNGGRTPLWTRHMLGVREAERDRRKIHRYQRV